MMRAGWTAAFTACILGASAGARAKPAGAGESRRECNRVA